MGSGNAAESVVAANTAAMIIVLARKSPRGRGLLRRRWNGDNVFMLRVGLLVF
jgi:hypothetical protein